MADAIKNFAYSLVATAPSPATSGTSLVVTAATGTRFAVGLAIVCPANTLPLSSNAEIVRITGISTDTLTITRTQESTSARTIVVGDAIFQGVTAALLAQYLPLSGGSITVPSSGNIAGLTLNQNDTVNNPASLVLTNTGTGDLITATGKFVVGNDGTTTISGVLNVTNAAATSLVVTNTVGNVAMGVYGQAGATTAEMNFGRAASRVWHMGLQSDGSYAFVESGVAVRLAIAAGGAMSYTGSIAASSSITSSGGGVGYATGAGGTVTQATNKATGVTLNKLCGTITLTNAALAAATTVGFVLTNSFIAAGDFVAVQHSSVGTLGAYNIAVTPAAGSATISVRNVHTASLSEAIVLRFFVNKAVTA